MSGVYPQISPDIPRYPQISPDIPRYPQISPDKPPVSWKNTDKPPVFNQKKFPPWCGPALMARGCFGALRLAAARPTNDKVSQKQANRQGMRVGETEAIIGKALRLGIHTWHSY